MEMVLKFIYTTRVIAIPLTETVARDAFWRHVKFEDFVEYDFA